MDLILGEAGSWCVIYWVAYDVVMVAELHCPNAVAVKVTEPANVMCKVTDLGRGLIDFVA